MPWWGWPALFAAAYAIRAFRTRNWTASQRQALVDSEMRTRRNVDAWLWPPLGVVFIVVGLVQLGWYSIFFIGVGAVLCWWGVNDFRQMRDRTDS